MKQILLIAPIIVLAGCANRMESYMPIQKDSKWSYQAEPGLQNEVLDLEVIGRVPVGDSNGWRLNSGWGETHLAWQDNSLISSLLGGTRYDPPLPILSNLAATQRKEWKGDIILAGKRIQANGYITTSITDTRVGSLELPSIQSTLKLNLGKDEQEILTWFVQDYGIVRQEQRKNGLLVNRISYLSGP